MNKQDIIAGLQEFNQEDVEKFASYCLRRKLEKKKGTQDFQNPFMQKKSAQDMIVLFKRVANDGLIFDGVHITLQSTGICYDYVAYKNKMLLAYPESLIDVQLVSNKDNVEFSKESGKVNYTHKFGDIFEIKDEDIIGAYCVIKNKRGEFLTTINKAEIEKHKIVAKGDFIWKAWFKEMTMKTIIKKACKTHFNDIYQNILEEDDKQNDIEKGTKKINEEKQKEQENNLANKYNLGK